MKPAAALVSLLCLGAATTVVAGEPPDEVLAAVRLTQDATLVPGRATAISMSVVLGAGVRLLDDAPLLLTLSGTALQPTRRVLRRRDAVDPRADQPRFEVEVRAERGASPTLAARLEAWVCRGHSCRPIETSANLPLTLAPAATR
jgi:hypothetical protein